jgi:1-acyl-sn-glycerol-3-phosphate acyltransferase
MGQRSESRKSKVLRRLRSIPLVLVAFILVTALLAVLLAVALIADVMLRVVAGRPPTLARLVLMLWCWLAAESIGLTVLFIAWVVSRFGRDRNALARRTFAIQQIWARWLFGSARFLFRLRVEVNGAEKAAKGPYLLFVRHTSILDNLLPAAIISGPLGVELRYVLKRELLVDPCFDVAGQRLPNHFVRRDSGDPAEIERVKALAGEMTERDAVLIYPEGTRATPERRERALERIAKRDPQRAERMAVLEHCLPPRTGGPLALLQAAPDVDVVLFMHAGLDGMRRIQEVIGGGLVRRRITVRIERIERSSIPKDTAAWLDSTWLEIDQWVDQALAEIEASG